MRYILKFEIGRKETAPGHTAARVLISLYTCYAAEAFCYTGQLYRGYAGLMARWSIFNVNFWWLHFKK